MISKVASFTQLILSENEEHYHINDQKVTFDDSSQWGRKPMVSSSRQAKSPRDNIHPVSQCTEGWDRKGPSEELLLTKSFSVVDPGAMLWSQERHAPILHNYDHRHEETLMRALPDKLSEPSHWPRIIF